MPAVADRAAAPVAQRRGWRSLRDFRADVRPRRRRRRSLVARRPGRARRARRSGSSAPTRSRASRTTRVGEVVEWFCVPRRRARPLARGRPVRGARRARAVVARARPRGRRRSSPPRSRSSFWLVLEVAAFASVQSLRVEERNMFYVAPLFLIALLVWIERGAPRPRPVAGRWPRSPPARSRGVLPYERPDRPERGLGHARAAAALVARRRRSVPIEQTALVVVLACVVRRRALPARARAATRSSCRRSCSSTSRSRRSRSRASTSTASVGALFAGITLPHRDWIDRAVGRDADGGGDLVGAAPTSTRSGRTSSSTAASARLRPARAARRRPRPRQPVTVDPETGRDARADGKPSSPRYVLADSSVELGGSVVAPGRAHGMIALRDRRAAAAGLAASTGLYPQDTWSGRDVSYTRLGCRGGTADGRAAERPGAVHEAADGDRADRREARSARVADPGRRRGEPARAARRDGDGRASSTSTVAPTAVPAVVTKGEQPGPARARRRTSSRFDVQPST